MRFCQPTKEQERGYRQFVRNLPAVARALGERFDPWTLYQLPSGQRVMIKGFSDDGTLRVVVSGEFNLLLFEREVFGINPDELTECDLPAEGEPLGALRNDLTLDDLRVLVRPDLWVMKDGTAVRKQ